MDVSRRRFLQGVATAAIAAVVPLPTIPSNTIDPSLTYGEGMRYVISGLSKAERREVEALLSTELARRAREFLPSGTRFEIRAMYPTDYGRLAGMAWMYVPYMAKQPTWDQIAAPDTNPALGYILQERLVA